MIPNGTQYDSRLDARSAEIGFGSGKPAMSINLDWFRDHVQRYTESERPRYKQYARLLKSVLEAAAQAIGPHVIVQARAKSVPSFAEKILRKRQKYQNPLLSCVSRKWRNATSEL